MSKKFTVGIVLIVIVVISLGSYVFNNVYSKNKDPLINKFPKNNVELTYENGLVSPMMSIVNEKKEVLIKIKFKDGKVPSEVFLMNKEIGERTNFKKISDNTVELNVKLEHGIDYGFIMDGKLAGGIKGVEDVKKANIEDEKKKMLDVLQCGL